MMNRRTFLQLGSAAVGASRLIGCGLGPVEGKVIVVGAGAAGCYAAQVLREYGADVVVLEASDRIGGRLGKRQGFADFDIDLGAQWQHGDNTITQDLVEAAGAGTFRDRSETLYWHQGRLKAQPPAVVSRAERNLGDGSRDRSWHDHYRAHGCTDGEYYLVVALSSDVGASPEAVSSWGEAYGYDDATSNWRDFKFDETYFDLIDDTIFSTVEGLVRLGTPVVAIDYSGDRVYVETADGELLEADRVIVTVPLTVLKAGRIAFSPPLPSEKNRAMGQLGMEAGMKAFLRFSERFFETNIAGGAVCAYYTDESYNRDTADHVLFGFIMGEQAQRLSDMGEEATIAALLSELDEMFGGRASESFVEAHIQDWAKEPHVAGAYSYPLVGADLDVRATLAEPVSDRVFFAGEATNDAGHHATVHGALETGYREAAAVIRSMRAVIGGD